VTLLKNRYFCKGRPREHLLTIYHHISLFVIDNNCCEQRQPRRLAAFHGVVGGPVAWAAAT
jgi:hypothetical protein